MQNNIDSGYWLMLIDSEKYDEVFSFLDAGLEKAFYKKTREIKLLKETFPSFNTEDMIRKGEIRQLKAQLIEFITGLQEAFEIDLKDEIT
jgi:hypothetical protein